MIALNQGKRSKVLFPHLSETDMQRSVNDANEAKAASAALQMTGPGAEAEIRRGLDRALWE